MAYIWGHEGGSARARARAWRGDHGGVRTLRLELTSAQWQSFGVQQQLARYVRALKTAEKMPGVAGARAQAFTFSLGASALTVPLDERLEVHVDGIRIGSFRQPFIQAAVAIAADPRQFCESGGNGAPLSTHGVASFEDSNGVEAHFARVLPHQRNLLGGTLEALVEPVDRAGGRGQGRLSWRYSVPASAVRHLAAGACQAECFIVADPHRRALRWLLSVTLTGSDDGPRLRGTAARLEGVEGDGRCPLGASGILAVDDLVRDEGLGVEVTPDGGNRLGGALEVVIDAANAWAGTERTTVYWSYSVPRRFALRPGEAVHEQFTVTFVGRDDRPGQQRLTISVTGTEHAPEIQLAAVEAVATRPMAAAVPRRSAGQGVTVWRLSGW